MIQTFKDTEVHRPSKVFNFCLFDSQTRQWQIKITAARSLNHLFLSCLN